MVGPSHIVGIFDHTSLKPHSFTDGSAPSCKRETYGCDLAFTTRTQTTAPEPRPATPYSHISQSSCAVKLPGTATSVTVEETIYRRRRAEGGDHALQQLGVELLESAKVLIDAERDREKQCAAWPEDSAEFLRRSGPVAGPTLPMRGVGGKASVVAADVFQCRQAEPLRRSTHLGRERRADRQRGS